MGCSRTTPLVILTLWLELVVSGCAMRQDGASALRRKAEQLATEQGRVGDLRDPVAKTKSYIRMSEILLDFAAAAAEDQDVRALKIRLDQYVAAVRSARATMMGSQRNAEKRPQGFKDLAMALRGQIGRLEMMSRGLSGDQRPPVDVALEVAKMVRGDMQQILRLQAG